MKDKQMGNPLLGVWNTAFGLPPFGQIKDSDFAPAFEVALAQARARVAEIASDPGAPTFANVIEALELSEEALSQVSGVFFNLTGADSTPAREALQSEMAPKLSAYASEITNNRALFGRIEALWQARDTLGLTPEQARVLELYRRMFVRSGALLEGAGSARLTDVKSRLAVLGTQFSQNLLADERSWVMPLAETDLAGLPDFVLAAARAAGEEKGAGGLVVTLLGLGALAVLVLRRAAPGKRLPPRRLLLAAALIAGLAILNLVIAGQSWGVVYGLGLWGAKLATAAWADLAGNAFWGAPAHAERLVQSLLTDVTSLTNIGLIAGAFVVMRWRAEPDPQVAPITARSWAIVLVAGVVLGYSARVALGCNVGAFFSGVSTGSLHGWVWFVAAFGGSLLGIRLRPRLLLPLVAASQGGGR